jgi:pimeloyl-ACP methyl ester carboxylesterase
LPFIDIDGMRVAYTDAGTGLPILFIPGLVGTPSWFKYQFSGLRENHRILSYEIRAARNIASYTLDLLTEDLARFLTALRIQSAVIAGHSFGAMIAQRFAATYPERTYGLVMIAAYPSLPEQTPDSLIEMLSPGPVRTESTFQSFLSKLLPHKKPIHDDDDAEGLDWLAEHSATVSRTTLAARLDLALKFDSSDWLGEIGAPTLIIVGARDRAAFLAGAQFLYEGISDSELEVIEDGDHFCFYMRHDMVNRATDDFLKDRLTGL